MNIVLRTTFSMCSVLFLLTSTNAQDDVSQNNWIVRGKVIDNSNRRPIVSAIIILRAAHIQSIPQRRTNSDGYFVFDALPYLKSFTIEVQKENYTTYISGTYSSNPNLRTFDAGVIALNLKDYSTGDKGDPIPGNNKPTDVTPPSVAYRDTTTFVRNVLVDNSILPTNGAKELFYALNPELRNMATVPANYRYKLPDFPRVDSRTEKEFNQQFKRDKNKDPQLFLFNNNTPIQRLTNEPEIVATNYILQAENSIMPTHAASIKGQNMTEETDRGPMSKDLEKFVFVMWKMDANGRHIENGPEVEGRFLVYYAGLYKEGDTSTYHRAPNATYGYATMAKATYKIIVIDQQTNQQVRISDPIIETNPFFQTHDLLSFLDAHPVWIKIPIRVFD
jgi:hypothetical protein